MSVAEPRLKERWCELGASLHAGGDRALCSGWRGVGMRRKVKQKRRTLADEILDLQAELAWMHGEMKIVANTSSAVIRAADQAFKEVASRINDAHNLFGTLTVAAEREEREARMKRGLVGERRRR